VSLDDTLLHALNGLVGRWPGLDAVMSLFGQQQLLIWPSGGAFAAWVLWRWREALIGMPILLAVFIVGDAIGAQIKLLIARPRPCRVFTDLHLIGACGKTYSFPSNHAMNTAAAAAFLQVLYPRSGWFTWPLVAAIGIARVYGGAHYPTDVIGGWLIGAAFGAGVAWLLLRWKGFGRNVSGGGQLPEARQDG